MLDTLLNWTILAIQSPSGYIGLFFFNVLSNTILPGSPEVLALTAWKAGMPAWTSIAVMVAGNYVGNSINYFLGRAGKTAILQKYFRISEHKLQRAEVLFEKYGPPILLFSWLPIIGDPLTFIPGFLRYNFFKFSVYVILGKIIRFVGLYAIYAGVL